MLRFSNHFTANFLYFFFIELAHFEALRTGYTPELDLYNRYDSDTLYQLITEPFMYNILFTYIYQSLRHK